MGWGETRLQTAQKIGLGAFVLLIGASLLAMRPHITAERSAQHGGPRRSIGLRHALGDDEAGDDQHGAGPGQRAGRRLGAARPEESRDAPSGGIESEQVVDRVKAGAGGGHGSGRYHTLRLTS